MDNNIYEPFMNTDDINNCICSNSLLTTGLVVGSSLALATVVFPTVRKVAVPTCKILAKQQLKLLAGIGVLSIATYISKQSNTLDNNM